MADTAAKREPLGIVERRILGVLIEKQKTTPDAYPMSLNGIVVASNQKSNRDPLLNLTDEAIEESIENLQKSVYVSRLVGGRTDKFRHLLYEAWNVDKVQIAILAELLLRGPQSIGDLRGRASRMEPIADLEELKSILRTLAEKGLVVWLSPEDRRGAMVTHGFHDPHELDSARHRSATVDEPRPAPATSSSGPMTQITAELESLKEQVAMLRREVDELKCARGP